MSTTFSTSSAYQTKKLGKSLAKEILKARTGSRAKILGLTGNLGGGKTTFLQGFAGGLGIKEKVLSPTFVIIKRYKTQNTRYKIQDFYHIDCYRIKKPKELLDLGLKEILANTKNIVAIEWADKIRKIVPKETIWIDFKFIDNKTREIVIQSNYGK